MQEPRKYTKEFKQDAVRLVSEQGYKQTEAARDLRIDRGMLGRWVKEFLVVALEQHTVCATNADFV